MRAIKIDTDNRTVTEIVLGEGIDAIKEVIDCRCFTGAGYLDNGDFSYCDDEFLFNNPQHFLEMGHNAELLAGIVLVTGSDSDGNTTDAKSTVDEIEKDIIWYNLADIRSMG